METTHLLAGTMINLGGKAANVQEGEDVSRQMVRSRKAFQKWVDIVREQGGDTSFVENPERMPAASFSLEVKSRDLADGAGTSVLDVEHRISKRPKLEGRAGKQMQDMFIR